MIRRSTLVMLGVFAIVLLFAWYWQSTKDERQSAETTPAVLVENLLPFDSAAVAKLTVENTAGERVVLRRDEQGLWQVSEPVRAATDIGAAESAVTQLTTLRVVRSLDPASDMQIFGLVKPAYLITVVLMDSQQHTLRVGDLNQAGNSYYVQLNDRPPQLVNKFSLDPVLALISAPPYQATATPSIGFTPEVTGTVSIETTPVLTTTVTP